MDSKSPCALAKSWQINRILGKDNYEIKFKKEGNYEIMPALMEKLLSICTKHNIQILQLHTDTLVEQDRIALQKSKKKNVMKQFSFTSWMQIPKEWLDKMLRWAEDFGHTIRETDTECWVYYRTYKSEDDVMGKKLFPRAFWLNGDLRIYLEGLLFGKSENPRQDGYKVSVNLNDELSFY